MIPRFRQQTSLAYIVPNLPRLGHQAPIMSSSTSNTLAMTPRQTIRGHTSWVTGVVHLPRGRHIITCSVDGSLRLWDLESGAQIGEDWRDESRGGVRSMALSPNGNTVASGSGGGDNKVRLWDVETRKVLAKWAGHSDVVCALCWSADGNQVLSGSWDGTARVWDVKSGKNVLTIKTGHSWVNAVMYWPNTTKIATGGREEDAIKIWDAKTGKLFKTLEHDRQVWSLTWTLDGEKLISGSYSIRIFNTATWQEIAMLEGHTHLVRAISLSQNERLLASASVDNTARLWNLDTNLQVGPPLQHENAVRRAALSLDGKLLVTACEDENAYTWDIHAILKEADLEDLLKPLSNVAAQESLIDADATRAEDDDLPPDFFNDMTNGAYSFGTYGNYYCSSARRPAPSLGSASVLFARLSSPFRRSHRNTDDPTGLQQRPRRSVFSRGPRIVEVAAVKDREACISSRACPIVMV
ncbi:WD40 repeat-like protein [Suillus weaverae]|nr:WD40 repeat-like protein [Suillus weaverae]